MRIFFLGRCWHRSLQIEKQIVALRLSVKQYFLNSPILRRYAPAPLQKEPIPSATVLQIVYYFDLAFALGSLEKELPVGLRIDKLANKSTQQITRKQKAGEHSSPLRCCRKFLLFSRNAEDGVPYEKSLFFKIFGMTNKRREQAPAVPYWDNVGIVRYKMKNNS
ncbi:MAG: hypothetical protein ACI4I3_02645 [Acutalibacteraceae bacterium]